MGKNAISWFEIPATDFNRAKKFYSTILSSDLHEQDMGPIRMGFLPSDQEGGVGGAICEGPDYSPSSDGARLYLNGGQDLNNVLQHVESAGGKVIVPKTPIAPEMGYFALFIDTEGNKMGLHSMS